MVTPAEFKVARQKADKEAERALEAAVEEALLDVDKCMRDGRRGTVISVSVVSKVAFRLRERGFCTQECPSYQHMMMARLSWKAGDEWKWYDRFNRWERSIPGR